MGTNEAFPILQGNFRNARRGTGQGSVIWERMLQDDDWDFFLTGIWDYQWTKTPVDFSDEINEAFYYECQGIIDIAIKLYKMIQWRAISLGGDEKITVDLIHQSAKDGLYLVKPMLDAIRSGDQDWMIKYKDIAPIDAIEYKNKCLSELESRDLEEVRRLARKQQNRGNQSVKLRHIIVELVKLDVEPSVAKECAEKVLAINEDNADIPVLVKEAYIYALQGEPVKKGTAKTNIRKTKPKYQSNDIRQIVENAKNKKIPAYQDLKAADIIKNPLQDFINIE